MTDEEQRALNFFSYLEKYPELVRRYIRQIMQDTLYRDDILNEFTFKKLIGKRAIEIQSAAGGNPYEPAEIWRERCREAKKQLIDFFFSSNYSLDYLKQLIVDHSGEIESELSISFPLDFEFAMDVEKVSTRVLIKKMDYYASLRPEDQEKVQHEMRELKVVLIRRLVTDNPEQVRIAERFFTMEHLREIHRRMIGTGKVGGKSTGMLMAYYIVRMAEEEDPYNFSEFIKIPDSYYLGDEVCINYLDFNGLLDFRNQKFKPNEVMEREYEEIEKKILGGRFPESIWIRFRTLMEKMGKKPMIVRSSSLLEDNIGVSFAGKYDSYFLPNQGTPKENLKSFAMAIKKIYGGVFSPDAIIYRKRSKMQYEYESMAILIQEVVGRPRGRYFFPDVAGVIFSENPYLWSRRIRKEDGMMRIVHGLGTRAVDRVGEDYPRMVSLSVPELRPEAQADIFKYSQKFIDLIDLEKNEFISEPLEKVIGENPLAASSYVYSVKTEDMIRPVMTVLDFENHRPVITFDRLLSSSRFPHTVAQAVDKIKRFYGLELDIEFAGNVDSNGDFKIYLLQCRPQSTREEFQHVEVPEVPLEDILFTCASEVSNVKIERIDFIVYVDPEAYDKVARVSDRYEIARLVGRINRLMECRTAILLGPGRWGSNNIKLGVPVKYNEINNFRLLGEIARSKSGIIPEVSFGTHFFQDLVESGIHCIPLYPDDSRVIFNYAFFQNTPNRFLALVDPEQYRRFEKIIKVFEFEGPRRGEIRLDGSTESGKCYLAACPDEEKGR
ncbi:MAG: PEP/pyruvate-binding domain-containing protein [Candidatus Eremiobacteraeota bacterium]|nr:PEP/pyruvate-binding domain-containing protein [Candidatus Eremiobacteraeota bacterium]